MDLDKEALIVSGNDTASVTVDLALSDAEKKVVQEAAIKAQNLNRTLVKEQTNSLVASLKKEGMVVTSPDLGEFKKATQSVFEIFSEIYGKDLMDKVIAFTK